MSIRISRILIDQSILLQVDAAVIAGLLILLTIQSFAQKSRGTFNDLITQPRKGAALLISPFAISAVFTIMPNISTHISESSALIWASRLAVGGFLYLLLYILVIAFLDEYIEKLKVKITGYAKNLSGEESKHSHIIILLEKLLNMLSVMSFLK